jgi:hypothetical protein
MESRRLPRRLPDRAPTGGLAASIIYGSLGSVRGVDRESARSTGKGNDADRIAAMKKELDAAAGSFN